MSHGRGAQVLDRALAGSSKAALFGDNSSLFLCVRCMKSLIPWFGFHYRIGALPLVSLDFRQTDLLSVITWPLPGSSQTGEV